MRSVPGSGAAFTIYFPLVEPPAEMQEIVRAGRTSSGEPATVLLVEDETALRGLMRRLLERSGYHVLEEEHGASRLLFVSGFTDDEIIRQGVVIGVSVLGPALDVPPAEHSPRDGICHLRTVVRPLEDSQPDLSRPFGGQPRVRRARRHGPKFLAPAFQA